MVDKTILVLVAHVALVGNDKHSTINKVQQLNGSYSKKTVTVGAGVRKTDGGVIAQDVEKVLPEVVGTRPNGVIQNSSSSTYQALGGG